jgi:hypothetical protein
MYGYLAVVIPVRATENLVNGPHRLRVAVWGSVSSQAAPDIAQLPRVLQMHKGATSTAGVIESLYSQGAHIFCLTKVTPMDAREEPMDAVEFRTAFNPRGHNYQSPAGSSS